VSVGRGGRAGGAAGLGRSRADRERAGAVPELDADARPRPLTVSVADDGARGALEEPQGGGHGLVGMRERVTMLGGSLTAGPREEGGWAVAAELPYGDPD